MSKLTRQGAAHNTTGAHALARENVKGLNTSVCYVHECCACCSVWCGVVLCEQQAECVGVERHAFYELVLSYYRARNHVCGAERDIDMLRRESTDAVDVCWNTVDDLITLQVCLSVCLSVCQCVCQCVCVCLLEHCH